MRGGAARAPARRDRRRDRQRGHAAQPSQPSELRIGPSRIGGGFASSSSPRKPATASGGTPKTNRGNVCVRAEGKAEFGWLTQGGQSAHARTQRRDARGSLRALPRWRRVGALARCLASWHDCRGPCDLFEHLQHKNTTTSGSQHRAIRDKAEPQILQFENLNRS